MHDLVASNVTAEISSSGRIGRGIAGGVAMIPRRITNER
jgi:hypothetical protein